MTDYPYPQIISIAITDDHDRADGLLDEKLRAVGAMLVDHGNAVRVDISPDRARSSFGTQTSVRGWLIFHTTRPLPHLPMLCSDLIRAGVDLPPLSEAAAGSSR